MTKTHFFCSPDCGCHPILGHKEHTPNKLACRKDYLHWELSCSSISTGSTLLSPASAEQHLTEKLQFIVLDEVPLPWGMKRSKNQRNSSYCCTVHQLLITREMETFSWIQADRLLGDLFFNPLHFGSKANISCGQLLPPKSNSKGFICAFILETLTL